MCCLKYEQDAYEDLLRSSPKVESFVDTPEGRGTVTEVDLLRQRVKVRMEESPETISVFSNEDIAILRSGKAKKNDPPIPDDLAPISGSGKRERTEPKEENPMVLEAIRFRYSTEQIVEEPEETEEEVAGVSIEESAEDAPRSRNRRRNRRSRSQGDKAPASDAPKQEKAEKQEKAPKADPAESAEDNAAESRPEEDGQHKPNRNHRRHNNHRRNRKPRPQGTNGSSQE